jgi:hypothetical protein
MGSSSIILNGSRPVRRHSLPQEALIHAALNSGAILGLPSLRREDGRGFRTTYRRPSALPLAVALLTSYNRPKIE